MFTLIIWHLKDSLHCYSANMDRFLAFVVLLDAIKLQVKVYILHPNGLECLEETRWLHQAYPDLGWLYGYPHLLLGRDQGSKLTTNWLVAYATRFLTVHLKNYVWSHHHAHSRPQRPCSFWSAPRIATSGLVQRRSGFEWLWKHNWLRPEPIRFVRLDSEHAQSDGSPWIADFRCWTRPEVAILGADQKERGLWGRECTTP